MKRDRNALCGGRTGRAAAVAVITAMAMLSAMLPLGALLSVPTAAAEQEATQSADPGAGKPDTTGTEGGEKPDATGTEGGGQPDPAESADSGEPDPTESADSGEPDPTESADSGEPAPAESADSGEPDPAESADSGEPAPTESADSEQPDPAVTESAPVSPAPSDADAPLVVNALQAPIVPLAATEIELSFTASELYTVESVDGGGSPFQVPAGEGFEFRLGPAAQYSFAEGITVDDIITGCTLNGTSLTELSMLGLSMSNSMIAGTIPSDQLTTDTVIAFAVDEGAFVKNIGVVAASGEGYTLEPQMVPSGQTELRVTLKVDAGYSDSTPALTAEGCSFEILESNEQTYLYGITHEDGTSFTENLTVTVSGIVPNAPPPPPSPTPGPGPDFGGGGPGGGGGDSDSDDDPVPPAKEPAIRVENELDQPNVSSDTTLWPRNTVEEDGVSTTTITDEELAALLELARKHREDTSELGGDSFMEGIILIEDLSEKSENQTYQLHLTDEQFQTLAAADWDRLTVQTPAGSFSLYDEVIRDISGRAEGGEGQVKLELTRLDHEGRPGVDAVLTVDDTQVTLLETPYGVRLFIPYTPEEGEDPNALTVDYIHEDGTVERVTECCYDEALGGLILHSTHLSKFGVVYRPEVFEDVGADHWANPYVTFLAARGLVNGYQGGSYRPDEPATRGEFISLAATALSAAKLPRNAVQVYSDVPISSYVAGPATWLYYNNLASAVTGGGKLRPDEAITREDMAALLGNIASGVGLRVRSKGLDTAYNDAGTIASYARQSVTRLRAAGILEMAENYKFNPKETLDRGEMAQVVATLLSSL